MDVLVTSHRSRRVRAPTTAPPATTSLIWQPNHSITRRMARIAREVYSVWHGRLGATSFIPADKVQPLFNDMQLYPSRSQVFEMLQCAQVCADRSSASYLTFGEFCVFATELKRCYERGIPRPAQLSRLLDRDGEEKKRRSRKISKSMSKYEVFLGGSCNPTTWRQDLAIPSLKSLGITFYNPQVSDWAPELMELEYAAKESATVLFFVMDNQTRCIAGTVEVAHIAGRRRKLILVIHPYLGPGQKISGEPMSHDEYEELSGGRRVLRDLVERQAVPVFDAVPPALQCCARVLRENAAPQDLSDVAGAPAVKMGHVQIGDHLLKLREAFNAMDSTRCGELCPADVCMAFRVLTNRNLSLQDLRAMVATQAGIPERDVDLESSQARFSFEQFCSVVAEFSGREKWTVPRPLRPLPPGGSSQNNCVRDVYLGGSGDSWREDIAIPLLKKNGLTYHVRRNKRLTPAEAAALDNCHVLLFCITRATRSIAAMAVAAHYIGLGCSVVLCIETLPEDCVIAGEKLSSAEVRDNNRGRMYLSDLANREGVAVLDNVAEAVQTAVLKCRALRTHPAPS